MIDRATINRILDAANIVDVIGEFVSLKKRGVNHIACCPFHDEKTPSFSVSPTKNIYKCFGCGKAGNVVNFVMEHEHFTYVEALKYLGKKYGIEIKERELTEEEVQESNKRESLMVVSAYAQEYFTKTLWENPDGKAIGLSYFREREFNDTIIKKFQLGYSPDSRSAFSNQAFKRYAWEEAEHASKFAELLGEVVWDTKTNLKKRMEAEAGACEDKKRIATLAKQQNLDAIHDTVHEMCKDEARHGKGFEGLYNRYFKK